MKLFFVYLKRSYRIVFFTGALFSAFSLYEVAYGWGDLGHETVGEIAGRHLSQKAQWLIADILGAENLADAATWPDRVRSDPRFSGWQKFDQYHFFDIPNGRSFSDFPVKDRPEKSAHVILSQAPQFVLDRSRSREARVILLRYLAHVVGDIHQPFHIGNGVDRGANLCQVKWIDPGNKNVESMNLHSVMDEAIFSYFKLEFRSKNEKSSEGGKRFFGYKQMTELVLDSPHVKQLDMKAVSKIDFPKWYSESIELRETLYPGPVVKNPSERRYCRVENRETKKVEDGQFDPAAIPVLDETWAKEVLPKIKLQLAKAGFRLAAIINDMAEEYFSEASFQNIIESAELREKP